MKQILLVDDEKYFRKALIAATDWDAIGYQVCGEADNGVEALEKVRTLQPDVIVTDINMSKMDGLSFISALRETKPDIKIIVISGYNKFDYVKRSLVLGVSNYITKPVDPEEFAKTLREVSREIDKAAAVRGRIQKLRTNLDTSIRLLHNQMLLKLLHGNVPEQKALLQQALQKYGICLEKPPFVVVAMEVTEQQRSIWTGEDRQLWTYAVENVSAECLKEAYRCEIYGDEQGSIYGILQFENPDADRLRNILMSMKELLWEQLGLRVQIGVSGVHHSFRTIHASWKEAMYALSEQNGGENRDILFYSEAKTSDLPVGTDTIYSKEQMLLKMRQGDVNACVEQLRAVERQLQESRAGLPAVHMALIEILSAFFAYASENADCISELFSRIYSEFLVSLTGSEDFHQNFRQAEEILRTLIAQVNSNHRARVSDVVTKVLEIIHRDYADNTMTVERLAQDSYTSYGYLCYLFKRDMNKTLNDYITDYRMEQARFLLLRGDKTVNEVAELVGFSNSNYFSKIFKKKYGVLPSNFRLKN